MASGELGLENLRRALDGFGALLDVALTDYDDVVRDGIQNGQIQKFEYCAELFWKYLRSRMLDEGIDAPNSPRGTIKAALAAGFIPDGAYAAALQVIDDRNTCSHVYRQAAIPDILVRLPAHLRTMRMIVGRLPGA
ncbi:MAG: nucleotidyltransferase substrate binding protein [Planctomycetaceae bacterium]